MSKRLLAVTAVAVLLASASTYEANAAGTIVAYAYVTGIGPFVSGQATPPGHIYEYQLLSDGTLKLLGTVPQTGTFAATTVLRFAYMQTSGGYQVYSIDDTSAETEGTLHDTGNKTGVIGPLAVLDQHAAEGGLENTGRRSRTS